MIHVNFIYGMGMLDKWRCILLLQHHSHTKSSNSEKNFEVLIRMFFLVRCNSIFLSSLRPVHASLKLFFNFWTFTREAKEGANPLKYLYSSLFYVNPNGERADSAYTFLGCLILHEKMGLELSNFITFPKPISK